MSDHDDHKASVSMHRDNSGHERWRCWSGDHRGDAIDLVTATIYQETGLIATRDPIPPGRWLFEIRLQEPRETVFFDV